MKRMRQTQPSLPAVPSRQAGFSLVEILVAVVVFLVLASIAAPNLVRAIRRYQLESSARNVANIILRTRYEAVNRNRRVATAFLPPAGNEGARYGIDMNGNGILDALEPRVMVSSQATFWQNNVPTLPPANTLATLPADYTNVAVPLNPAYSVSFSPRGTVVVDAGGGNWQLAPQVQLIAFVRGDPNDPPNFDSWLIGVTPAGRVRVWFWAGNAWTPS
ncbi:MAG: Tfp pilus assembly protein FimT/FimU [Terriglobia bacterium]